MCTHTLDTSVMLVNALNPAHPVDTESEQNQWGECARLIANAIIYYNAYLLDRLIEQMADGN